MKKGKSRQALRTRPVPEKLRSVIELINLIPPGRMLGTAYDVLKSYSDEGRTGLIDWVVEYEKMTEDLPRALRSFIGPIAEKTLETVIERYSYVVSARELLREIANWEPTRYQQMPVGTSSAIKLLDLVIEQKRITYKLSPLLEAINGVEAERIRQCPICQKIYWAGRTDQPACSRRCVQTLRVSRWRARYYDKYKEDRVNKANEAEKGRQHAARGLSSKR